jgi:hypothetical protein
LTPATIQELEDLDVSNQTSDPAYWALFGGLMRLFPTPNGSYTVSYAYTQKPATLSATPSSNVWTTNAYNLIEARALWWLHNFKTRNFAAAREYKGAEMEALRELQGEAAMKASGRIRPTSF